MFKFAVLLALVVATNAQTLRISNAVVGERQAGPEQIIHLIPGGGAGTAGVSGSGARAGASSFRSSSGASRASFSGTGARTLSGGAGGRASFGAAGGRSSFGAAGGRTSFGGSQSSFRSTSGGANLGLGGGAGLVLGGGAQGLSLGGAQGISGFSGGNQPAIILAIDGSGLNGLSGSSLSSSFGESTSTFGASGAGASQGLGGVASQGFSAGVSAGRVSSAGASASRGLSSGAGFGGGSASSSLQASRSSFGAASGASSALNEEDEAPVGKPEPYSFNYESEDEQGNKVSRQESGDDSGTVTGSYTITDLLSGTNRVVNYIADASGFRAQVETNEPGTLSSAPADVQIQSSAPPPPQ